MLMVMGRYHPIKITNHHLDTRCSGQLASIIILRILCKVMGAIRILIPRTVPATARKFQAHIPQDKSRKHFPLAKHQFHLQQTTLRRIIKKVLRSPNILSSHHSRRIISRSRLRMYLPSYIIRYLQLTYRPPSSHHNSLCNNLHNHSHLNNSKPSTKHQRNLKDIGSRHRQIVAIHHSHQCKAMLPILIPLILKSHSHPRQRINRSHRKLKKLSLNYDGHHWSYLTWSFCSIMVEWDGCHCREIWLAPRSLYLSIDDTPYAF